MADEVTQIALGFSFSTCSEPDGDHVHVTIVQIPHGLAKPMVDYLSPIINAAVVEFFAGLQNDRNKMQ